VPDDLAFQKTLRGDGFRRGFERRPVGNVENNKEIIPEVPSRRRAYLIGVVVVLVGEFLLRDILLPQTPTNTQVGMALLAEWVMLGGLLAVWVPKVEGHAIDSVGLGRFEAWHLLAGIRTFFLVMALMTFTGLALGMVGLGGLGSLQYKLSGFSLPVLLGIALTGTFLEEIVYRGYIMERLISLTGRRWVAGLVSWLSFTLVHLRFFGLGPTLDVSVIGAGLVILYLRERSLWPCILVHGLNDFFALVLAPWFWGS
jgi:membrane protease YdiL (CAAX protease family)